MPITNALTSAFNPLELIPHNDANTYAAELMRNQVSEIIGSYHHQFDHFYECLQNATDACEKAYKAAVDNGTTATYSPLIKIIVNLQQNSLTVIDNGLGMTKDVVLKYFFTPYATLKSEAAGVRQRGEKGVGSAFLSYGSNQIHLTTKAKDTGELTSGELKDALKWCNKQLALQPMPNVLPCIPHTQINDEPHGTAVTITFSEDTNMTHLYEVAEDMRQWETILRLYTAIGFVDFTDSDPFLKSLRATLLLVARDGSETSKSIESGYYYPHLATPSNIRLSSLVRDTQGRLPERQRDMNVLWEQFTYEQLSEAVTTRMENIHHLRSNKRDLISSILNYYKPEAYVAFSYGSDYWEETNNTIWGTDRDGYIKHGVIYSTKSQKIGEQKRIDFLYRSGDFNRFFIVLNMLNLKGDVGRKSLKEEIGEFANFFANSVQKKFIDNDDCLKPSPGPFSESLAAELEQIKDAAFARTTLPLDWLNIVKIPQEEQDVLSLFFNLLGAKKIRGYEIYSTHISRTYDGVGRFMLTDAPENHYDQLTNRLGIASDKFQNGRVVSASRCFIEFKYSSDGLVRDIRSGYKRLQDIKWLVCWEIGDKHISEGIGITDITEPAQVNHRDYYGVTHTMTEGQDKVYILCLKTIIDILRSNT